MEQADSAPQNLEDRFRETASRDFFMVVVVSPQQRQILWDPLKGSTF